MFARLRRSRLALVALLALSPAGLGTILPVLHPCPVDAPWLAGQHQPAQAGHHAHHNAGSAPTAEHRCTCVGSCLSSAVPAFVPGSPVERIPEISFLPQWADADASLVLQPLSSLLPPATAPPLV